MASRLGQPDLVALDVPFDPAPLASSSLSNSLLVASEGGLVLHASAQPDHKPNPRSFKPEFDTLATCR